MRRVAASLAVHRVIRLGGAPQPAIQTLCISCKAIEPASIFLGCALQSQGMSSLAFRTIKLAWGERL